MSKQPVIVFVDDEESVLKSLQRVFFDTDYNIVTFSNPEEALNQLPNLEADIIVSDQMMPGIRGAEFLERAVEVSPLSNFLMLTAFPDYNLVVQALNEGNITRFLTKPWHADELQQVIASILEDRRRDLLTGDIISSGEKTDDLRRRVEKLKYEIKQSIQNVINKNQELYRANLALERNLWDTIKIFFGLIEKKSDFVGQHCLRVSQMSRKFSLYLNLSLEQTSEIEIGALLHDIGKMSLPDTIVGRIQQGLYKNEEELVNLHPLIGQYSFYGIQPLKKIGAIIRHHHEKWNGTGFPDRLKKEDIPFQARIIQVCNYYDNLISVKFKYHPNKEERAVDYIKGEAGNALSPEIAGKFLMFLKEQSEVRKVDESTDETDYYNIEKLIEMAIAQLTDEDPRILTQELQLNRNFGLLPNSRMQPRLVKNMFLNLLRNAAEALSRSGVITINAEVEGSYLKISIIDTGVGIPDELVQKIFEPGFTTKRSSMHKGMGLTEVYDALKFHRGKMELKSIVGKGTKFTIYLAIEKGFGEVVEKNVKI